MQLEVKDFSVRLGGKEFLHDICFSINSNETVVINGTNGSGKSTLAKAICAFGDYECNGSLILNGRNILKLNTAERAKLGIFLSLQEPIEIAGLSYAEMLKAALDAKGKTNVRDFQLALAQNLELLKLNPFMAQKHVGSDLSGGEKKKMEVLQILMLKPKLIFLDEIDSGLDAKSASLISKILRDYQIKNHASFIVITHNKKILENFVINKSYQLKNKTLVAL